MYTESFTGVFFAKHTELLMVEVNGTGRLKPLKAPSLEGFLLNGPGCTAWCLRRGFEKLLVLKLGTHAGRHEVKWSQKTDLATLLPLRNTLII